MTPVFQDISAKQLQQISIIETEVEPVTFSDKLLVCMDEIWSGLKLVQPALHASPLCRVVDFSLQGNNHCWHVVKDVTYKDIVGIRNIDNFFSHFVDVGAPRVLSIIAFVYTNNGDLLLVERSSGDWPVSLELPGAFVRPDYGEDLYQQALNFLQTDLAIEECDIKSHAVLGTLKYPGICEQMIVTSFSLNLSLEEIQSRTPKTAYSVPVEYKLSKHTDYFNSPLHVPSETVISMVKSQDVDMV